MSAFPGNLTPRSFFAGNPRGEGLDGLGMDVTVEWRGGESWAVCYRGHCATKTGRLAYEPQPSSRTPAWLRFHRFPLEDAARIASLVLAQQKASLARGDLYMANQARTPGREG